MDLTICEDEEDVVNLVLNSGGNVGNDLLENGAKESGSVELDELKFLSILLKDALSSGDFRVREISIEGEAMVNVMLTHELRNTSKSIDWEALVRIIAFKNGSNRADSMLILIVSTKVVKRIRLRVVTV
jgi:hypothetical protein